MKASEIREKSPEDQRKLLLDLLREQFGLRMQKGTGQLTRPSRLKAVRREIARVRTVINEQAAGGAR